MFWVREFNALQLHFQHLKCLSEIGRFTKYLFPKVEILIDKKKFYVSRKRVGLINIKIYSWLNHPPYLLYSSLAKAQSLFISWTKYSGEIVKYCEGTMVLPNKQTGLKIWPHHLLALWSYANCLASMTQLPIFKTDNNIVYLKGSVRYLNDKEWSW